MNFRRTIASGYGLGNAVVMANYTCKSYRFAEDSATKEGRCGSA